MTALYEIANEYQILLNDIMECEEISAEQMDALTNANSNMEDKAKAVAAFIRNMESEQQAIENAIIDMKKRSNRLENKISYMKNYLKENMEKCNIKEVKSPYFDIKIRSNPISVMVIDEKQIPKDYFKEKIFLSLDKVKIRDDLKNNIMVPGTTLFQNTRLEII